MITEEMIKVMQAHVDGKHIEVCVHDNRWKEVHNPRWDWCNQSYRVKPELLTIYIYRHKSDQRLCTSTMCTPCTGFELIKTITVEI